MENYDEKFYNDQKGGSLRSAREVLSYIYSLIKPKSVIDIGCGLGTWLSAFKELGVEEITGMDGNWVNKNNLYIDKDNFIEMDLENPVPINRKFDLAMSLEVAEHLKKSSAEKFVNYLTSLSSTILFSAAIPNQGGTNHINEQNPEYWIELFKKNNFNVIDCIRGQIWENTNIEIHYRQNMFLFVKEENYNQIQKKIGTIIHPYYIVHPEFYDHVANSTLWRFAVKLNKISIFNKVYKLIDKK